MKVVRDNTVQSRGIFCLDCLEPLGFEFGKENLELGVGARRLPLVLILRQRDRRQHAQGNRKHCHLWKFHMPPTKVTLHPSIRRRTCDPGNPQYAIPYFWTKNFPPETRISCVATSENAMLKDDGALRGMPVRTRTGQNGRTKAVWEQLSGIAAINFTEQLSADRSAFALPPSGLRERRRQAVIRQRTGLCGEHKIQDGELVSRHRPGRIGVSRKNGCC